MGLLHKIGRVGKKKKKKKKYFFFVRCTQALRALSHLTHEREKRDIVTRMSVITTKRGHHPREPQKRYSKRRLRAEATVALQTVSPHPCTPTKSAPVCQTKPQEFHLLPLR